MHVSLSSVLLVVSVASLAAAGTLRQPANTGHSASASNTNTKKSFRIDQVANPHFKGHSLGWSVAKAHRKFNITVTHQTPSGVRKHFHHAHPFHPGSQPSNSSSPSSPPSSSPPSSSPPSSSSPPPSPSPSSSPSSSPPSASPVPSPAGDDHASDAESAEGGWEWLTPVSIGTPPQSILADVDTGSSDLWIMSTETVSGAEGHDVWDPSKSTTAKLLAGASWNITYNDGSNAGGDVYFDRFAMGDLSFDQQAIESATEVSASLANSAINGLIGLALGSLNRVVPNRQATFFENVAPSLAQGIMVADLNLGQPGAFYFGEIPPQVGQVLWGPVNATDGGWWRTTIQTSDGRSFEAISDTGTTLTFFPDDVVSAFYAQVPTAQLNDAEGGYIVSCTDAMPDFSFSLGGGTITIPGSLIPYAPISEGMCIGALQNAGASAFLILGDSTLRAAHGLYDLDNLRVGFAQK